MGKYAHKTMAGTNYFSAKTSTVDVALTDSSGNAVLARCTVANLPTDDGYAVGCIIQATDTGDAYTNTGTTSVASFVLLESAGASLSLPAAATDASTTTGKSLDLTQNAITTGVGIEQDLNGLTTGVGHLIAHTTAVIADGGSLLRVTSSSVDTGGATNGTVFDFKSTGQLAGTMGRIDSIMTTGTVLSIIGTGVMTTTGNLLTLTADSATTAAGLVRVSGAGLTTGLGLVMTAAAATLTTGRYFSANDGALEVFGIGANGHIHTSQTTAPTIAVSQQNGITAAAITAGASDVCGIITTTGTNDNVGDTILQVTFHKTYTAAPKTVTLQGLNASAVIAGTAPYISAITATTFDITIPASASSGATPSFSYQVIA